MSKTICFVTTTSTTLQAFVLQIANHLHKAGDYQVTFICDANPDFEASLPEHIVFRPVRMNRGFDVSAFAALSSLYRIFRTSGFDIVQYSTPNAALYASLASWTARVPTRLYCQWGIRYVGFRGFKRFIFKQIERVICLLSTWIEPDSFGNLHFSRRERLYTSRNSSVIWNGSASGVDLRKFDREKKSKWRRTIRDRYGIDESSFVLGFVGRLSRDKGANELLFAARELIHDCPNSSLMIVGSQELADVDLDLLEWSQNESRVICCGHTSTVEQYLAAFDVFILPSYREGFGSVVVEAEAMGVPVVVSDIPGPRDAMIPLQTGLVVKVADTGSLLEAIRYLHSHPEIALSMSEKAVVFARERFDHAIFADRILSDRDRLLGLHTEMPGT